MSGENGGDRAAFAIALAVVTALGIGTMLYGGPASQWITQQVGGVFYVLAGIFLVLSVFPKTSPLAVSAGVFLATCGVEFLQLWQPPVLQDVRATFFGRVVLGNAFSWADMPYYAVGAVAGLLVARRITRPAAAGPAQHPE